MSKGDSAGCKQSHFQLPVRLFGKELAVIATKRNRLSKVKSCSSASFCRVIFSILSSTRHMLPHVFQRAVENFKPGRLDFYIGTAFLGCIRGEKVTYEVAADVAREFLKSL